LLFVIFLFVICYLWLLVISCYCYCYRFVVVVVVVVCLFVCLFICLYVVQMYYITFNKCKNKFQEQNMINSDNKSNQKLLLQTTTEESKPKLLKDNIVWQIAKCNCCNRKKIKN